MSKYRLILPWPPSNNTYWRHSRGRHYISKKGKEYREQVIRIIKNGNLDINLTSQLKITIYASAPDKRKRDLDNLQKSLFDSLTHANFWVDDSQIDDFRAIRCESGFSEIALVVEEIEVGLLNIKNVTEDWWYINEKGA